MKKIFQIGQKERISIDEVLEMFKDTPKIIEQINRMDIGEAVYTGKSSSTITIRRIK